MIDKFCDLITEKIISKVTDIDEERELIINFGVRLIFGELPNFNIIHYRIFIKYGMANFIIIFLNSTL